MNLQEKLKQLPNDAGVYQYFDKNGHLLYVGKAKVLKNRVKSYFKFNRQSVFQTKKNAIDIQLIRSSSSLPLRFFSLYLSLSPFKTLTKQS